jgi:hypothetical protein
LRPGGGPRSLFWHERRRRVHCFSVEGAEGCWDEFLLGDSTLSTSTS